MKEINEDRIWVLASNKHRSNGILQFWGYLTPDEAEERSFGGYTTDFLSCERYSTIDKENSRYNDFPILDRSNDYIDLNKTEHYWIKIEELEKCSCYRKKTIFEEC